jgi:hypothetical protein
MGQPERWTFIREAIGDRRNGGLVSAARQPYSAKNSKGFEAGDRVRGRGPEVPYDIAIDSATNCYVVKWRGEVTRESIEDYITQVAGREELKSIQRIVHDLRHAKLNLSSQDMRPLTSRMSAIAKARGDYKVAGLVGSDVNFGIARMWMAISGDLPRSVMVFRDFGELKAWIDLPEDYVLDRDPES